MRSVDESPDKVEDAIDGLLVVFPNQYKPEYKTECDAINGSYDS